MSKGTEFTGKNVEAAVAAAVEQLGKPKEDLEIQVLSQGSRGVFGLGGEPARILARDPTAVEAPPPEPVVSERPRKEPARPVVDPEGDGAAAEVEDDEAATTPTKARPTGARAEETEEVSATARDVVEQILTKMGFEVEVSVRSAREPVTLDVRGDNLGVLIGRRGDSLAALQFMVNVILSKRFHQWPRVVVDVQGYRARREQSLSSLGLRVADRVRRNRRPFTLEAMPANDRRIIHLSLRDRSDVETYSIGEGTARRVVIAPKR